MLLTQAILIQLKALPSAYGLQTQHWLHKLHVQPCCEGQLGDQTQLEQNKTPAPFSAVRMQN